MSIVLTEEQVREINAHPEQATEVVDPSTGRRFALVPSNEYESLRDRYGDEAFSRVASRMLGKELAEDEA